MADLLTDAERAEARAAFYDLKDTFHKTPIVYRLFVSNLDRFNETRRNSSYTIYNLVCTTEYGIVRENDRRNFTVSGSIDDSTIKVTFNVDYLKEKGLWNDADNIAVFDSGRDNFKVKGVEYIITQLGYEGELEDRPIQCVIYGDPKQQNEV